MENIKDIDTQISFANPIGITHIGDPFILRDNNGSFFLYATSFVNGFRVWSSSDLSEWKDCGLCYKAGIDSFGYEDFWAPEVVCHNGCYIMHYSARWKKNKSLRIGVAISDSPSGPFIDIKDEPMFDLGYPAIDGHVFIDDDGEKYFYFAKDCSENIVDGKHESHMMVAKLDDSLEALSTEPIFLFKAEHPWETMCDAEWSWNEGPFMLKQNHLYYLMYSANFYASKEYSICYAVSDSPMGPFIKGADNPILAFREGLVSGPGHNSVIKLGDELLCAYHVHTDYDNPSQNRQVYFDKMRFENGQLKIDGPTVGKKIVFGGVNL